VTSAALVGVADQVAACSVRPVAPTTTITNGPGPARPDNLACTDVPHAFAVSAASPEAVEPGADTSTVAAADGLRLAGGTVVTDGGAVTYGAARVGAFGGVAVRGSTATTPRPNTATIIAATSYRARLRPAARSRRTSARQHRQLPVCWLSRPPGWVVAGFGGHPIQQSRQRRHVSEFGTAVRTGAQMLGHRRPVVFG